jgi:hypothetical protein
VGTVDAYLDLKAAKVEMVLRAINDAMVIGAAETITVHGSDAGVVRDHRVGVKFEYACKASPW